jgi:hypothetical protein
MSTVRYLVEVPNDDRPTTLPGATRAVLAQSCAAYDLGQGGVTADEIDAAHVAALITFPVGSELFVESSDCLDETDETTEAASRIWWRVVVEGAR